MVESLDAETAQLTREQKTDENETTDTEKLEEKATKDQETTLTETETEETVQDVENTSQDANSKESVPESNEIEEVPQQQIKSTNGNEENNQKEKILKGILKHERTYSNKHVGFTMNVEYIPFDEAKDFTAEIEFVKELTKRVKSYRELFQQMKEDKEKEEREKQKQENEEDEENEENKNQSECESIVRNDQGEDKTEHSPTVENQNLYQKLIANENTLLEHLPVTNKELQNETNEKEPTQFQPEEESSLQKSHENQDLQQGLVICEENNKQQVINEIKVYKEEKNGYTNKINRAQEENDSSVMNM